MSIHVQFHQLQDTEYLTISPFYGITTQNGEPLYLTEYDGWEHEVYKTELGYEVYWSLCSIRGAKIDESFEGNESIVGLFLSPGADREYVLAQAIAAVSKVVRKRGHPTNVIEAS